jgi:competence protein ComEC
MENFGVGELIVGHAPPRDREYRRLERSASGHGVAVGTVASGERFELDGVQIDVLWPKPAAGSEVTSGNNDSVVLRIVYGSTSFLMAGDLEHPGEESLVQAGVDLHADILKVGHHGSKTSSTDAFLDRVQPKYAVISVGERSRFGHPHAEVVQRYLARGIKLYQTGRDGTVTAETDGNTLKVKTYRGTGRD